MTRINTTITSIGDTKDHVNFDHAAHEVEVYYEPDYGAGAVVMQWDGKKYPIDEIRQVLAHAEYIEQLG